MNATSLEHIQVTQNRDWKVHLGYLKLTINGTLVDFALTQAIDTSLRIRNIQDLFQYTVLFDSKEKLTNICEIVVLAKQVLTFNFFKFALSSHCFEVSFALGEHVCRAEQNNTHESTKILQNIHLNNLPSRNALSVVVWVFYRSFWTMLRNQSKLNEESTKTTCKITRHLPELFCSQSCSDLWCVPCTCQWSAGQGCKGKNRCMDSSRNGNA